MADGARSDHGRVQAQLDRLNALSPGKDVLGLSRIAALLERLGNPQDRMPPVFHVAGTNGKGSTCAYLRAAIEAAGMTAHVYSSPHLVRFNERIRLAGHLIEDDDLADLLSEVLDVNDCGASFFEITTAATFLAFSRTPADAAIIEVGLGGRLDATNIIARPAVCGIASLGIDHEAFLLAPEDGTPSRPLDRIAWEKAGIAKPDVPLVHGRYEPAIAQTIADHAAQVGAPVIARGREWDAVLYQGKIAYRDRQGSLTLPLPRMAGPHQADNAALAIAMLRHQQALTIADAALAAAMGWAHWPARLQHLEPGPLYKGLRAGTELWLDGGHNLDAAHALRAFIEERGLAPVAIIMGMLSNKDARGFIDIMAQVTASLHGVPVPGHDCHAPLDLMGMALSAGISAAGVADTVPQALAHVPSNHDLSVPVMPVLICGSLYLAGVVLSANEQLPV